MNELHVVVARLYSRLETIAEEHEELTDTAVREALHKTLNYYFVWGKPCDPLPRRYAMYTREGDEAVAEVIAEFLQNANVLARQHRIAVGTDRLLLLQDASIRTPLGECYDLFIGHADAPLEPAPLDPSRFKPRSTEQSQR